MAAAAIVFAITLNLKRFRFVIGGKFCRNSDVIALLEQEMHDDDELGIL